MAKRRKGRLARLGRTLLLAIAAWAAVTSAAVVELRWVDPPTTASCCGTASVRSSAANRATNSATSGATGTRSPGTRRWPRSPPRTSGSRCIARFDFKQIDKALADRERGRRVRGASSISQQVAKNLFLWPGQSWFRKGLEAGLTVLIELAWPKQRILEVYLNIAEFGRGT